MGHVMRDLSRRWPHARIPFEVDLRLSLDAQRILQDAIFFWNNRAGVLLTPRAGEPDFVFYTPDIPGVQFGGHSDVGRAGGRQDILMDFTWSEAVGALLHETGHAAGLMHEHQRPDRDQFVLAPPTVTADTQILTNGVPIGGYDCRSVMQYYLSSSDPAAFRTKAPGCFYAFHGVMLSEGDIRALQSLYWGCSWAPHGISARDIGVGADGTAWVIGNQAQGADFTIHGWDGAQWIALPGAAVRISASSSSSAWVVNAANAIFEWVGSGWKPRPGAAHDIAACPDGSAWKVGTSPVVGGFDIQRWDGASWSTLPGGALRIAARSRDDAVIVDSQGEVYEFDPGIGNWTVVPATRSAHDVAIGPDGTIGRTDVHGGVSFYSRERKEWADIDAPPSRLVPFPLTTPRPAEISIGPNGLPWVVNADHATYERTAMAP